MSMLGQKNFGKMMNKVMQEEEASVPSNEPTNEMLIEEIDSEEELDDLGFEIRDPAITLEALAIVNPKTEKSPGVFFVREPWVQKVGRWVQKVVVCHGSLFGQSLSLSMKAGTTSFHVGFRELSSENGQRTFSSFGGQPDTVEHDTVVTRRTQRSPIRS